MSRRHLLTFALSVVALSACQSPRATLSINRVPAPNSPTLTLPESAGSSQPASVSSLVAGTVMLGESPLGGAQVVVKDALTGKLLGGASADQSGAFSIPVLSPPSSGLMQVVASKDSVILQALSEQPSNSVPSAYHVFAATPDFQVDLGTTLVAQTLSAKVAEIFLADSSNGVRAREMMTRVREFTSMIRQGHSKAESLADLRRNALSRKDVRENLSALIREANEDIVAAFKEGKGSVFEISHFKLPEAGIDAQGPTVTIDRATGKVTIVFDGKVETIVASSKALEDNGKAAIALAASLAASPSTSLKIPTQDELATALTSRPTSSGSRGGSSGGGSSNSGHVDATPPIKPKIWIDEVVLADTNQSILGANAAGALKYDPEGRPVRLKVKGKLNAEHPPKLDAEDYQLSGFPFEGLIQQTFVGKEPKRRVLLDGSVWLPLDVNSPPTDSELTVVLNTKSLVDLAWSKLHRLNVIDREDEAVAEVRVANSEVVSGVQPFIVKVEAVGNMKFQPKGGSQGHEKGESNNGNDEGKDKDKDKEREPGNNGNHNGQNKNFQVLHEDGDVEDNDDSPKYLRVEGFNLPISVYAHWAQVNGVRVYAHATWITDEEVPKSVLYLHLPENFVLKPTGQNELSYANPFGFRFLWF